MKFWAHDVTFCLKYWWFRGDFVHHATPPNLIVVEKGICQAFQIKGCVWFKVYSNVEYTQCIKARLNSKSCLNLHGHSFYTKKKG